MTDLLVTALNQVADGHDLDAATARAVMDRIMEGEATPAQVGAILAALRLKGESVEELTGMVESMRDHAVRVTLEAPAVDTCGTGGDLSGTFNISTAAALVAAGAGCPVAKHGNRAQSSRCGSADVLEALGVAISLPPEGVVRCIRAAGIGFMLAPAYHPAMRHVAPVRRELGIRTAFNVIGPLANPARVRHQLVGSPSPALAEKMAGVMQRLGHRRALVFAGADGTDELVLHAPAHGYLVGEGGIEAMLIDPAQLGVAAAPLSALAGGGAEENAQRMRSVLGGERGPVRDCVLLNAGAALYAAERVPSIEAGMEEAEGSVDSGAARARLELLVRVSSEAAA
jgi:anthranilate phosphoribosyltransferase